jgi:hypothetical protein
MRTQSRLIFLTLVALLSIRTHAQTAARFTMTIHAGDTYIRPIGHHLYFAVEQADGADWNFQIKPSADSLDSFTDCLASPFLHGPTTQDLVAWRFAPGADAGYAEHIPASKPLLFVTSAADRTYECANSEATYNSFQQSQAEGRAPDYRGLPHKKNIAIGHGKVIVTSFGLKPGLTGQNAEFSFVTLSITIKFPQPERPSSNEPHKTP